MEYKIAVFPGDGVGPELINEGIKVIEKAAELDNFKIEWVNLPHGAEHYEDTKEQLNEQILKDIKNSCDAVYCGTFGNSINDEKANGKSVPNILRNYLGQSLELRPIKLLPGVQGPLAGKMHNDIDFTLIRECSEDFYVGASGRAKNGKNRHNLNFGNNGHKIKIGMNIDSKGEIAYQIGVLSKKGCEGISKYAFEYAKRKGKKKIVAVDKANILDSYNFWREKVAKVSKNYPEVEHEFNLIDAAVINLIMQPEKYEIIVAPNMFGDILSDLGTIIQGGLSFAARGNINPEGISMFEPVHGSAPKLRDKGIVNPIATIWAGALMLDNLGQSASGELMIKAIESVLKDGRTKTHDLDGHNSTSDMGTAIMDKFVEMHE